MSAFTRDERGKPSAARTLLLLELLYVWGLGLIETLTAHQVSGPVWALHASLVIALVAWAAGPRIAQHIGGQIAGAAQGVAATAKRLARVDDSRKDDERDP